MRVVRSSQNFANTEFLEVCKDHSFLGLHGSPCLLDTWDAIASRGGGLLIFLSPPTTEGWWEMLRTTVSKVMWVGRATVFLVGLAVILAVVLGVATAALAGTGVGATSNLGKLNTVNQISRLVGSTDNPMLWVDNNGAGTNATALDL